MALSGTDACANTPVTAEARDGSLYAARIFAVGSQLCPTLETSWAFVCGLVASGRLAWLPAQSLRVVTAWLAVDLLLSYALAHWGTLKTSNVGRVALSWQPILVPYAQRGSPGASLAAWLSAPIARWRESESPSRQAVQSGVALIAGLGVSLLLATYAGPGPVALIGAGCIAITLIALIANTDALSFHRWSRAIQVAAAWTMGHLVLGGWRTDSLGLSAVFGLSLLLESAQQKRAVCARRLGRGIWLALTATMLLSRQPVAAAAIGIAALASDMSARNSRSMQSVAALTQRAAWLAASMVSAVAATYWG